MRKLAQSGGKEPARRDTPAARAAQERREERESRLTQQGRSVRLRAAAVAGAVLLVLGGCCALQRSSLLPVRRVEVAGNHRLVSDRVIELARIPADATLIRFPGDEVADRVGTDPWVRRVTVSRVFPDGMRIRIEERDPVAMVDAGKVFWMIDASGMIIAQPSPDETATLVSIRDVPGLDPRPGHRTTSEPVLNALHVMRVLDPAVAAKVRVISAPSIDGTTLYTSDRLEIVYGSAESAKAKNTYIARILADQRGKVVTIDVRTPRYPTWRKAED